MLGMYPCCVLKGQPRSQQGSKPLHDAPEDPIARALCCPERSDQFRQNAPLQTEALQDADCRVLGLHACVDIHTQRTITGLSSQAQIAFDMLRLLVNLHA